MIDGRLDDDVWGQAPHRTEFWHLEIPGRRAAEETTIALLYDDDNLYFAFDCQDYEPDQIRADQRKRGGELNRDDHVAVDVDVLNLHTESYHFAVSARGTQTESVPGGAATQVEWRGDWRAAAAVTPTGWQAEMAIPLPNLRYLPGADTFGLTFTRYLARRGEESSWPNLLQPGYDVELAADWVGLVLPRPQRPVIAMPYLLTDAREGGDRVTMAGLDLKHDFASGLTVLATAKPDFRTIEDEVESVDFTYTERALSERRPFFAEAAGAFFPPSLVFYSRRIGEIDLGLKAFGRANGTSLGLLATSRFGQTRDLVAHTIWKPSARRSWWGGLAHHAGGDHPINTALCLGFAAKGPVGEGRRSLNIEVFKSQTAGPGGDGSAYAVSGSRHWAGTRRQLGFSIERIGSGYDSVLGFVPERGVHEARLSSTLRSRVAEDGDPWLVYGLTGAVGGSTEGRRSDLGGSVTRRLNGTFRLSADLETGERDGFTDRTVGLTLDVHRLDPTRKATLDARSGKRLGRPYAFASLTRRLRPNSNLSVDLSAEHLRLDETTGLERRTQILVTAAYDLTPEKTLSGRLVLRDGRANIYLAYRRAMRAGPDLFILLGDPNAERTTARLATKLVWPFLY